MIGARPLGIGVFGLVLSTPALHGQTAAHYRDFQLGSDLATVAALTGVAASDAKIIHSAVRLDERDAPQRERARQKKEADDERAAKAKARVANKAAFKP